MGTSSSGKNKGKKGPSTSSVVPANVIMRRMEKLGSPNPSSLQMQAVSTRVRDDSEPGQRAGAAAAAGDSVPSGGRSVVDAWDDDEDTLSQELSPAARDFIADRVGDAQGRIFGRMYVIFGVAGAILSALIGFVVANNNRSVANEARLSNAGEDIKELKDETGRHRELIHELDKQLYGQSQNGHQTSQQHPQAQPGVQASPVGTASAPPEPGGDTAGAEPDQAPADPADAAGEGIENTPSE